MLHACEHYCAVTEKHEAVTPGLPVLRDHDKCVYLEEDAGGLLVGAFEKRARAWGRDGIPADFSFDQLPGHREERPMPVLEEAMVRVPTLARLLGAGEVHGLKLAGMHALDSCRTEKKFLHFGHDVADGDTPLEAGVGFVCAMDKRVPSIGRDAIARQRDSGAHPRKRLVQFVLDDPEPLLWHHEPIRRGDECVGYLTGGNHGHTLGAAVGLGHVRHDGPIDADRLAAQRWSIEIAGERHAATAGLRAAYDPTGERVRA